MDASALLLTGIGLASAAGLNAYIPLLIAGLLAHFDVFTLSEPYDLLATTPALVILAILLAIELLADKIPAVDSVNDVVQTLMRPASGAVLFAAAFGADSTWTQAAALIAGMVTAGTVHTAKAAARPVVNVSTGGVGAPVVSTIEDIASVALTLAAIFVPVLVLVLLALLIWFGWRLRQRWRRRRLATGTAAPSAITEAEL